MSKQYQVTIKKQHPAHDERDGLVYDDVSAKDKAQAIRFIRRQAEGDGHIGSGQGRYTITAIETSESN